VATACRKPGLAGVFHRRTAEFGAASPSGHTDEFPQQSQTFNPITRLAIRPLESADCLTSLAEKMTL